MTSHFLRHGLLFACVCFVLARAVGAAPVAPQDEDDERARPPVLFIDGPERVCEPGEMRFFGRIRGRGNAFTLTVAGSDVPVDENRRWEVTLPLARGDHAVEFVVTDARGIETRKTHHVVALPPIADQFDRVVLRVGTVDEFLERLGPDRIIVLRPGVFDLAKATTELLAPGIERREGSGNLTLRGIENLDIIGTAGAQAKITTSAPTGTTFVVQECDRVRFIGLELAHEPEGDALPDASVGGILSIKSSHSIWVRNCELYGEGLALHAYRTNAFVMDDSTVRDCTGGFLRTKNSKHMTFQGSRFLNNGRGRAGDIFVSITGYERRDLDFVELEIRGNRPGPEFGLFDIEEGPVYVYLKQGVIEGNEARSLRSGDGKKMFRAVESEVQEFGS